MVEKFLWSGLLIAVLAACAGPEAQPLLPDGGMPEEKTTADAGQVEVPDGGADAGSPVTVSYQHDVQPVWNQHCTGCHSGGKVDLRAPGSRERLLAQTGTCWTEAGVTYPPLVKPGDPAGSVLWHKAGYVSLNCGREMPPEGKGGLKAMDPAAFAKVEEWIRQGALDN